MTLVNENSEKMKSPGPAMTSPVSVGAFSSITKDNFGESRVKAKDNQMNMLVADEDDSV